MNKELLEAKTEFKKVKKNHQQERRTYLEDLAEALEGSGSGTKALHLRRMMNMERQREKFRRIKAVTNANKCLITTFIITKNSEGVKEKISDKN